MKPCLKPELNVGGHVGKRITDLPTGKEGYPDISWDGISKDRPTSATRTHDINAGFGNLFDNKIIDEIL